MGNAEEDLLREAEKHYEKGDLILARNCYEKILAKEPGHLEALNNLGVVLFQEHSIDDAIDCFHAVLGMDETNSDALTNLRTVEKYLKERRGIDSGSQGPLRVGFVSIWFERGQSYVTRMIRDAVAVAHHTFVFARTGGVYGQPMLERSGSWAIPNMTVWDRYDIPGEVIVQWVRENRLDVVVFNEEYDWELVKAVKGTGVKVLTYLDYYKEDWKANMGLYDAVLCSTQRTFRLVKDVCPAFHMGWGVDTGLFSPSEQKAEYTFFHNAGWLGINFRKMTPAVIAAFDAISRVVPNVTLLVHSQASLDLLPPVVVDMVRQNPRITYHIETVPAPGLYHKGKIMVFPTKLEGLGLPLFEALSCGLPVIATNAPPMNEFIRDGYNGSLVHVSFRTNRGDNVAFPEEIVDMRDLAVKMAMMADDENMLNVLSENARRYAEDELAFPLLTDRILNVFKRVC